MKDEYETVYFPNTNIPVKMSKKQITECTSGSYDGHRQIPITQCDTEELRNYVKPEWPDATREQLLAYFKNRHIESITYQEIKS